MSLYVPYYRPYNKHNTNIHAPSGIRTRNPSKRAAADRRLRAHGHWDRRPTRLSPTILPTRYRLLLQIVIYINQPHKKIAIPVLEEPEPRIQTNSSNRRNASCVFTIWTENFSGFIQFLQANIDSTFFRLHLLHRL
jgi:hypothetical protein